MAKILIVEDENELALGLAFNLRKEGHTAAHVSRGDHAVNAVLREQPDLVLLDVMLPGQNGLDVCRALRSRGLDVPVIMLTARGDEVDRVVGLEIGADDYVTKPFSVRELLARINARLRRAPHASQRYSFSAVTIDFDAHQATRGGQPVDLTPKELELLHLLVRHRGRVVSRHRILSEVWGYDEAPNTRTVDTHILKLRQKLEDDPAHPRFILSIYGEGYKFAG